LCTAALAGVTDGGVEHAVRSVDGPEAFGWLSVLSHEASMMLALTQAVSAAARRICFM
jgi:hypothetical protein